MLTFLSCSKALLLLTFIHNFVYVDFEAILKSRHVSSVSWDKLTSLAHLKFIRHFVALLDIVLVVLHAIEEGASDIIASQGKVIVVLLLYGT